MDIESIVPPVKPINANAANPFADSSNPFDEEDITSTLSTNRRAEIYEGVPDFSDDDSTPTLSKSYITKPPQASQPTKSVTISWSTEDANPKQNAVNKENDKIKLEDLEPAAPTIRSTNLSSSTAPILNEVYQPWQIQFYGRWFDVDTKDVFLRMSRSLVPYSFHFFRATSKNPDLYGPFWIATTLIFFLTICSHFSRYISDRESYAYNFSQIGEGAIILYLYLLLPPLALTLVFTYFSISISALSNIAVYGYSLTPYLIFAVISIFPNNYVKWGANLAAGIWGAIFLMMQYAGGTKGEGWSGPVVKVVVVLMTGLVSLILCVIIKFTFFPS
eukprot:TRINITY_DN1794_c0_g1_i1.p1 TRINITY_DN1794_c0_g1~~TRINITY_DN1794_c0_g1_i1.p1  ORF type:complete len:332 (-),score=46.13 TRINITY_DN1794_c0_g1_i1:56-1051(-)